ncbi:hypothetical protein BR93DRAFT_723401 [Coniochaeta sp. PMI_546]|nr:hypothetical protein BR93DRAFT_723401 [Coniochaeta sp. PMI_546]
MCSLEACQHEDDAALSRSSRSPSLVDFGHFIRAGPAQMPLVGLDPVLESLMGQQSPSRWSTLNASLFGSLDSGEDIHLFMFRSLCDTVGHRQAVEHVTTYYFNSVNYWFTIIEKRSFDSQVERMWSFPSAEVALLILCMLLIIRTPNESGAAMDDGLYLSVKTAFTLVQSKIPPSISLLQAQLLIGLYEYSHGLSQQAYMSMGSCVQMTRSFGWHLRSFWSEERQQLLPADLKLNSILWWALVYVDSMLNVSYPDQKLPLSSTELDFSVPFPEAFDQYLPGNATAGYRAWQGSTAENNTDKIDNVVWPEANSAWYLSTLLHQIHNPTNPPTVADRNSLSDALSVHTLNVMGVEWRHGTRCAAINSNFIALMKANQPYLLSGMSKSQELNMRHVNVINSVINSMYQTSQSVNNPLSAPQLATVAPTGAFALYYASMLLMSHGDNVLNQPDWLHKIESFQQTLRITNRRWRIAARYLSSIDVAFSNRLGRLPSTSSMGSMS